MRMVFPNSMTGRFMDDLASDMNTLVETLFGDVNSTSKPDGCGDGKHAEGCEGKCETESVRRWSAPMDIVENDKAYMIYTDLPGVDADAIEIDVDDDVVTIGANRKLADSVDGETRMRSERRFGKYHRVVTMPKSVDSDAVEATYVDGVLTVTLPKKLETKNSKRVTVRRGDAS